MRRCDLTAVSSMMAIAMVAAVTPALAPAALQEQRWRERVAAATEVEGAGPAVPGADGRDQSGAGDSARSAWDVGGADAITTTRCRTLSAQGAAAYYDDLVVLPRSTGAARRRPRPTRADQIDHHVLSNQVQLDLLELSGARRDDQSAHLCGDDRRRVLDVSSLRDYAPARSAPRQLPDHAARRRRS